MKKFLVLAALLALAGTPAPACTTFLMKGEDYLVFGRNYDWVTGNGLLCTNLRGLAKTSYPVGGQKTISWISRFGSVTFNQYGKEFPTGGINEKGLVVELMWLDGTKYSEPDDRSAIGVLQWIQYQLDNSTSVQEVIDSDKKLRISSSTPLHYLVADANGDAATIEFLDGTLVVHRGNRLTRPVLTNSRYAQSDSLFRTILGDNLGRSFDVEDNSLKRFSVACLGLLEYELSSNRAAPVPYAFQILQQVSQGSHTKWSIVYDITNREIHFRSFAAASLKTLRMSDLDFSCGAASLALNMNQAEGGDVAPRLEALKPTRNEEILRISARESGSQVGISEDYIGNATRYAEAIRCHE